MRDSLGPAVAFRRVLDAHNEWLAVTVALRDRHERDLSLGAAAEVDVKVELKYVMVFMDTAHSMAE